MPYFTMKHLRSLVSIVGLSMEFAYIVLTLVILLRPDLYTAITHTPSLTGTILIATT